MDNHCFEAQCAVQALYTCSCTVPDSYFCAEHFCQHLRRKPGKHIGESLFVELESHQNSEFLSRLKEITNHLHECRSNMYRNAKQLIDYIELSLRKNLKTIHELEVNTVKMISGRSISKEFYELILSFTTQIEQLQRDNVDSIKDKIKGLFEFKGSDWTECNEMIFSRDPNTGGLVSIDLTTFKLSALGWAPKIFAYSQACKINKNTYFFHGGLMGKSYLGDSYLINIQEMNYKILPTGKCNAFQGSVLKDDKVYIFGGYTGGPLTLSETFDLKSNTWKSRNPLPCATQSVTAALLNKEIILSGFEMNCCYSYDDKVFSSILSIPARCYKIVCEGWIFASSTLHENIERNKLKWVSYNINNPWNTFLFTNTVFQKKNFLYFIDYKNSLMRIDTILKKLEAIAYN